MRKKIKTGLIIGTVGLLVISGYLIQKPAVKIDSNNNSLSSDEFLKGDVDCADLAEGYTVCVEKSETPRNAEVPLKVGRKFIYEVKNSGGSGTDTYTVEKIENIEGIDYYVVLLDRYFVDKSGSDLGGPERAWFDKNTGEVIRYEYNQLPDSIFVIKGRVAEFMAAWNFAPWMLALEDDFYWRVKYKDKIDFNNYEAVGFTDYKVVGREKVGDRETFKVKITSVVDSKIDSEEYVWIDVQERILIKASTGAILISEN